MSVISFLRLNKVYSLPKLQGLYSRGLSILAKARMRTITDKGTEIGLRAKLFKEVIPAGGIGVELGVYKGTLSKFILETNQPSRLHLVDPWWKWRAEWHWAIGDKSTVRSFGALVIALEDEIASRRVEIHIKNSLEAIKAFEDEYLDWAYIDSTHSYETTKAEIMLLTRKINPNGIIAGDDWREDPKHKHHGVYRAVKEFLTENPSYNLIFQEDAQWAISKVTDSAQSDNC
ncbi:MAG: class I SAM-dependent methyltransferase [Desulfobacteraceae bacterium]|nr:MAG: class I SAM-dependent methyltransferase [Desulfobacteraceae bacterium]